MVWVDALRVNSRQTGVVKKHAVYLVMGMNAAGERSVLGMWTQQKEGATFWMSILDNLKKRGVNDILFLCADGLTGMSQADESIYPKSLFQTCVVHMIRSSVSKAPYSGIHAGLMQSRCPGTRPASHRRSLHYASINQDLDSLLAAPLNNVPTKHK